MKEKVLKMLRKEEAILVGHMASSRKSFESFIAQENIDPEAYARAMASEGRHMSELTSGLEYIRRAIYKVEQGSLDLEGSSDEK